MHQNYKMFTNKIIWIIKQTILRPCGNKISFIMDIAKMGKLSNCLLNPAEHDDLINKHDQSSQ